MKNWKTTTAGIAGAVSVLAIALKAVLDGDPTTQIDWALVGTALLSVASAVGFYHSIDAKTTSTDTTNNEQSK